MARRYDRESGEDLLFQVIFAIIIVYLGWLALLFYTNRGEFWYWLWYGFGALVLLLAVPILWLWLASSRRRRRELRIIVDIKNAGLEDQVNNFITRFGRGEKTKNAWGEYRGYKFDWNRIDEILAEFAQRGVPLNKKEFDKVLRYYIDKRENEVTLGGIQNITREFSTLSGSDFEGLLQRLYGKMGYTVQHTGRTGDQGGDLIVTKAQERLLVQAKCYQNRMVGNDAVQQAHTAKSFYDCSKATVVTTSDFTREAIEAARATGVELVSKSRLQQLLLEHLSESWN